MPHPLAPLVLLAGFGLLGDGPDPAQAPNPPALSPADLVAALESAMGEAIARAEPSVVAIAREKDGRTEGTMAVRGRLAPMVPPELVPGFRDLPNGMFLPGEGDQSDPIASDFGSGVVVGVEGQILTTFHVVRGATRLVIRTPGNRRYDAEIIAADPRSDLAVIVPRDEPGRPRPQLRPIPLGDGTKLRKGAFLIALGNPFNAGRDGTASASWGILANVARRLDPGLIDSYKKQLRNYPTLLQLDAKLNLGMSGGAVVNMRGELVGLTTNAANAGGFDSQAGYALPIDTLARRAVAALVQGHEVEYGFLGVRLSTQNNSNRIEGVEAGTPAGEGGLVLGDEIVEVGDLPVTDADSLVLAVNAYAPGQPIRVRVLRNGQEVVKQVVLAKLPVYGEVIATNRPSLWRGIRVDFVSARPNPDNGPAVLKAMAAGGVLIAEVQPGSFADLAGLKAGQIITALNKEPIRNPADFARISEKLTGPIEVTTEGDRTVTVR